MERAVSPARCTGSLACTVRADDADDAVRREHEVEVVEQSGNR